MSAPGQRASARIRGRPDWRRPLPIIVGLVLAAGFLILALAPIVR